ncbi:MAG: DUF882 domain-containing protein [Firmicutes bacterium]|nr:DUF882 domain-containing protein [Bacillota bacterium]
MAKISSHFTEEEAKCKCGCGRMIINPILVRLLEAIRAAAGHRPVRVHSWNRCEKYNRQVGAKPDSQHLYGMAADISIAGVTVTQLAKYAEDCGADGIGTYPKQGFIHVDIRGYRARWQENAE